MDPADAVSCQLLPEREPRTGQGIAETGRRGQDDGHKGCGVSPKADSSVPAVDPTGANPDPLLDARAAAAYLGLTGMVKHPEQAVRSLCRKRRLTHAKVCGKIMVRQSELDHYVRENTIERVA